MVSEDREFLEQLMHEDASLVSCGCFPGRRSIEDRELLRHLVEACRYVGRLLRRKCRSLVVLGLESGRFRKPPPGTTDRLWSTVMSQEYCRFVF